jgi:hypothetical protein
LVDIRSKPIQEVTPTGLRTADAEYALDAIVFATGFDAMTGAMKEIDIHTDAGTSIQAKWEGGPHTYPGLMIAVVRLDVCRDDAHEAANKRFGAACSVSCENPLSRHQNMKEVMVSELALVPRVDPRIKAVFATFELPRQTSVASREEILAEEGTEPATARAEGIKAFLDAMDTEAIAPSTGLSVRAERFTSSQTAIRSTSSSSGRRTARSYHASTTFTAAGWRRCPATAAITAPGAG